MSQSSSQDKTEKATPKRESDARKRGQVPRSRELSTALVVGATVLCMLSIGGTLAGQGLVLMREMLTLDPALIGDPSASIALMGKRLLQAFMAIAPILGASLVAALAAPTLIGGWNFSTKGFAPDFSRLSPLAGIGRMVSGHALMELLKSLIKFIAIGSVGAMVIWSQRHELMSLSRLDAAAAIGTALSLALTTLAWMTGALLLIGFIDAPYQRWQHNKKLRMTKQEVRDEMKESEGRPEVKAKIRQMQHAMSKRRMMEAVPSADVIITNPTHYAVALKYSAGKSRAPVVVAKGAGVIAAAIRELGQQNRVPLVSAPPLARALYRSVELDQEIPTALYQAVAQVLTYIYQLRGGNAPNAMPDFSAPVPGGEPDA